MPNKRHVPVTRASGVSVACVHRWPSLACVWSLLALMRSYLLQLRKITSRLAAR